MAYTTIDDPSTYFQTVIWTGDGQSSNAVTFDGNSDLEPDMTWIKNRDGTNWHVLHDSSRGITKVVYPNDTNAEETNTTHIVSWNSDGLTLGDSGNVNTNTTKYVAWNWKCNGGSKTTVSTTGTAAGSTLAGTYQANTTAGFSICTFTTGADDTGDHRVNHGLGAVPHFVIIKERDGTYGWYVWHQTFGSTQTGAMHDNTAAYTWGSRTGYGDLTSTYFEVDNNNITRDSQEYVAYAWTELQGYSKFGSFLGNGTNDNSSTDGPFVYTGFKPAYLMVKKTSGVDSWVILDNKRGDVASANPNDQVLYAESTSAEYNEGIGLDFLSNGFRYRDTGGWGGGTAGGTYIYAAFAEQPFVTSGGVPCTAI